MVVNPVHLGNCSYDVSLSALRLLIVVNSSIYKFNLAASMFVELFFIIPFFF